MRVEPSLYALSEEIVKEGSARGLVIATVESCTGGLVAGCVTAVPGSSAVLDRAFVTYSVDAKAEMVGVDRATVGEHGVVSVPVARQMAEGGVARSLADVAVSITGWAGPGERTPGNPVGRVCLAVARKVSGRSEPQVLAAEQHDFDGGRDEVRAAAVRRALELVLDALRLPAGQGFPGGA